jgi:tRNA(fMet)-specific endonuclease VapC
MYNQLLTTVAVLPCDTVTALIFARLRVDLDTAGKRIPLHDTWIAALAKQYSLTIATRDAHFDVVPGVIVERW